MSEGKIASIVKNTINSMSNKTAKRMIEVSTSNDVTIDDYFLSIRTGVVVASIGASATADKEKALNAVTNDRNRSMCSSSLEEDIAVAINYINKNYVEGKEL